MDSFSGFMEVLSSVAMKPHDRSLKLSRLQGEPPRTRKMSTSLLVNVQFTSRPIVPDAVVVNGTGPTVLPPSGPLPCVTTLVTAAGWVVGGVGGVQPGPAGLSLHPPPPPQLGSESAAMTTARHARTASVPSHSFRRSMTSPPAGRTVQAATPPARCSVTPGSPHTARDVPPAGEDERVSGTRCQRGLRRVRRGPRAP